MMALHWRVCVRVYPARLTDECHIYVAPLTVAYNLLEVVVRELSGSAADDGNRVLYANN